MKYCMQEEMEKDEKERWMDKPPSDDCCPICYDAFDLPCQTNCRHWYCANCILTFWNYSDPLSRCKCPICSGLISMMRVEESAICNMEDTEVVEAFKKVHRYNCLFAGGALGLITKAQHHTPEYCRRFLIELFDPCKIKRNCLAARAVALSMTLLYTNCGFGDFQRVKTDVEFITLSCIFIPAMIGFVHKIIKRTF